MVLMTLLETMEFKMLLFILQTWAKTASSKISSRQFQEGQSIRSCPSQLHHTYWSWIAGIKIKNLNKYYLFMCKDGKWWIKLRLKLQADTKATSSWITLSKRLITKVRLHRHLLPLKSKTLHKGYQWNSLQIERHHLHLGIQKQQLRWLLWRSYPTILQAQPLITTYHQGKWMICMLSSSQSREATTPFSGCSTTQMLHPRTILMGTI